MRSKFGRLAAELRQKRNLSQTAFAAAIGEALSRVSNLENQRITVSDDVVSKYIRALNCSGEEAHDLRQAATLSNSQIEGKRLGVLDEQLYALLRTLGDKISPRARSEIMQILSRELGSDPAHLFFKSREHVRRTGRTNGSTFQRRPELRLERFVELCLAAEALRQKLSFGDQYLDVERFLEQYGIITGLLEVEWVESMPVHAEGAFACIVGHAEGHTILIEEGRYAHVSPKNPFVRHVLAHEFAHHVLHEDLLRSDVQRYLPPQDLARMRESELESSSNDDGFQVIDTDFEVDAECFATMLLVPWMAFVRGTAPRYLADDYGEQVREVERYHRYFSNPAVLDRFRKELWKAGRRDHPVFSN